MDNESKKVEEQKQKKPGFTKRLVDALLAEDYNSIFKNIYKSIMEPALQQLAVEVFKAFVYRGKNQGGTSFGTYTPYDSLSAAPFMGSESQLGGRGYEEIPFRSKEDARRVLQMVQEHIQKKGPATVADYFKYAGKTPAPTYYDHGWANLNGAYVSSYYDAKRGEVWYIHFPDTVVFHKS